MKRPGPLGVLVAVIFVDLLGFGMIIPLMPRYARELGAPVAWIGLLSTGYSGMQLLFAPVWGRLSDRVGRRPVLIASLFLSATAFLLYGLAGSFWALLGARIFAGAATANISIAQAYVADVTGPEDRARGMGLLGAAFGLGFVLGPAIGGVLGAHSLGTPAFVAAGICAVNAAVAFFVLPEPEVRRDVERGARWAELRAALARPRIGRLLLVYLLVIFAFSAMENTFALLTADRFHLDNRDVGYVFAYLGVLLILAQGVLIRPLARRYGEGTLVVAGSALMALALALLPFAPGLPGLLAACVPLAIGQGLVQPSVTSLLSRAAGAGAQGGTLGVGQSVGALGRIVGPLFGTAGFHVAPHLPYLGGAVVMVAATLLGFGLRARSTKGLAEETPPRAA